MNAASREQTSPTVDHFSYEGYGHATTAPSRRTEWQEPPDTGHWYGVKSVQSWEQQGWYRGEAPKNKRDGRKGRKGRDTRKYRQAGQPDDPVVRLDPVHGTNQEGLAADESKHICPDLLHDLHVNSFSTKKCLSPAHLKNTIETN
jgi:hypothetical protein